MSPTISYRLLLEHVTDAMIHLSSDLKFRYVNPAAEILLGKSTARLKGRRFAHICGSECGLIDIMHTALNTGKIFSRRELEFPQPGNKPSLVNVILTPLPEENGLLLEVTPIDRLYSITQESQRAEEVNTTRNLLRGLAHEIKNPLGGIRGAAQLLEGELEDEELHAYTRIIIHETDRLRRLLDQMTGPRSPLTLRRINIHEVVERVYSLLANQASSTVQIYRDYDPSIPEFEADPDKLIQAVLNVGQNALEAVLETGGRIDISTRVLLNYTVNTKRHDMVVHVGVHDNGPGIAPELQGQIFYPMVTNKAIGTGLGLSVAQSLISAHGGLIRFESSPGSTHFDILIPLKL